MAISALKDEVKKAELASYADAAQAGKAEAYTLTAQDCGRVLKIGATCVLTLPATVLGYTFIIENDGAEDGDVQITLQMGTGDKIAGPGITAADNKDYVNTLATAKRGDRVKIFGDGTDGWFVQEQTGIWAKEA